jgi:hypothetical protein
LQDRDGIENGSAPGQYSSTSTATTFFAKIHSKVKLPAGKYGIEVVKTIGEGEERKSMMALQNLTQGGAGSLIE